MADDALPSTSSIIPPHTGQQEPPGTEPVGPTNTTVHAPPMGIYGWRKRCLYTLLVLLLLVGLINLALITWILWVMDFSVHGMGKLRFTDHGIKLDGDAIFLEKLKTSRIEAAKGSALNIYSKDNLTLSSVSSDNRMTNRITLGDNKCVANVKRFQIRNKEGRKLFSATENKITIGAEKLKLEDPGNLKLNGSLETNSIKGLPHSNLRVQSPTRGMYITAKGNLELKSSLGGVTIASSADLTLKSSSKSIRLSAGNISMRGLQQLEASVRGRASDGVYQLCVCRHSGLLFLSHPSRNCVATAGVCP